MLADEMSVYKINTDKFTLDKVTVDEMTHCRELYQVFIIKRVSWFKSSLLLRIQTDYITNINS
jgi:hypothetical protein